MGYFGGFFHGTQMTQTANKTSHRQLIDKTKTSEGTRTSATAHLFCVELLLPTVQAVKHPTPQHSVIDISVHLGHLALSCIELVSQPCRLYPTRLPLIDRCGSQIRSRWLSGTFVSRPRPGFSCV